jgi:dimeric dUTPase (all-alpha-NTP-PPase superfamily)
MSNIVFILGAGASKQAGAPLMKDFIDTARDLYSSNDVDNKNEDFQKVFTAISELQRVHSKSNLDIDNIEAVFFSF